MQEKLPNGLRVVRRVRARPDDAFDAWVNPERLRAWFGPSGTSVVSVDGELAVGGEYVLALRGSEGRSTELVWSFREIVPAERLVFGWRWRGAGSPPGGSETIVSISFHHRPDGTEIELRHTDITSEPEREMISVGWAGCFDGLEAILHQLV